MRSFASRSCENTFYLTKTWPLLLSFSRKQFEVLINDTCCFVHFVSLLLSRLRSECVTFTFPKKIFPAGTQTSNSPAAGLTLCPIGQSSSLCSLQDVPAPSCSLDRSAKTLSHCDSYWQPRAAALRELQKITTCAIPPGMSYAPAASCCLLIAIYRRVCRPRLLTHWAE